MSKSNNKDKKKPAPTGNTGTKSDKEKITVRTPTGNLGTYTRGKTKDKK